jgi:hypothetical protein
MIYSVDFELELCLLSTAQFFGYSFLHQWSCRLYVLRIDTNQVEVCCCGVLYPPVNNVVVYDY